MHFLAVLNKGGGTLRTTDLSTFVERMTTTLENGGHTVEVELVEGSEIVDALKKAAKSRADVVLAGGGDGTISAAAGCLMETDKALAVLPAGTMNLFARSIGIPLALDAAVQAFAEGEIRNVDIATANGRPFIHQYSIGMHAKLVELREKMEYGSRLGKMRASMRAAFLTLFQPPRVHVDLDLGEASLSAKTAGIGVSNNLFGEGHLPYADRLDEGVLGIYITTARTNRELMSFLASMMLGRWKSNPRVEIHETKSVRITARGKRRVKYACVMDGELGQMQRETLIQIHPGALKVLTPKRAD